jgi:hypothetical protein
VCVLINRTTSAFVNQATGVSSIINNNINNIIITALWHTFCVGEQRQHTTAGAPLAALKNYHTHV